MNCVCLVGEVNDLKAGELRNILAPVRENGQTGYKG